MVNKKQIARLWLVSLLLALFVLNSTLVFGEPLRVFDEANLFTTEEFKALTDEADIIAKAHNLDIVVVTTRDAKGKTAQAYADDFFDSNDRGFGDDQDGVLFLLDLDHSEVYISTSGKGINYLTDQRIKNIMTQIINSGLGDGKFFDATKSFLSETKRYLELGVPSGQISQDESLKSPNSLSVTEGVASVLSSLLVSAGFYSRTKSKYKIKNSVKPPTSKDNSLINLLVNEDKLVETTTSNRPIPKSGKEDSAGEVSTTHTSGNGKTHGGGGAKF